MLRDRDAMLEDIKIHLLRAKDLMKNNADEHRKDLQFSVGSFVFLKLRPYRQNNVTKWFCQKLAGSFMGTCSFWNEWEKLHIVWSCLSLARYIPFFMCLSSNRFLAWVIW